MWKVVLREARVEAELEEYLNAELLRRLWSPADPASPGARVLGSAAPGARWLSAARVVHPVQWFIAQLTLEAIADLGFASAEAKPCTRTGTANGFPVIWTSTFLSSNRICSTGRGNDPGRATGTRLHSRSRPPRHLATADPGHRSRQRRTGRARSETGLPRCCLVGVRRWPSRGARRG
jgi:hypothetical protein